MAALARMGVGMEASASVAWRKEPPLVRGRAAARGRGRALPRGNHRSRAAAAAEAGAGDEASAFPADATALVDEQVGAVAERCGLRTGRLDVADGPNGRGLFAAKDFEPGEPLLAVPLGLCVLVERAEAISVPGASWAELTSGKVEGFERMQTFHETYPLPWSIRASLALLDLVDGSGGRFWQQYASLLPAPEDYSLPLVLPDELLDLMADETLAEESREQRRELFAMCPSLAEADGSDGLERRGALWAAACVRSRGFALGDELFAVAPFLDMANHTARPNAEVGTQAITRLGGAPTGNLQLVATRPIKAGEEVTISYGPALTNEQLFTRYGFTLEPPPPRDGVAFACVANAEIRAEAQRGAEAANEMDLPPRPPLCLDLLAFEAAAADAERRGGGSWLRSVQEDPVLKSALASLPLHDPSESIGPPVDPETELASARELLEEATIRLDGAADPDEDQEWLDEYGPQMEDYRAVACVAYRARRTRVWLRCQSLLATYVASLEAAGVGSDEYVAEKERRKAERAQEMARASSGWRDAPAVRGFRRRESV